MPTNYFNSTYDAAKDILESAGVDDPGAAWFEVETRIAKLTDKQRTILSACIMKYLDDMNW